MKIQQWYEPLRAIQSRGSTAPRPGSLAGLHAARRETLSQFFSSDALVALLWRLVSPAIDAALARAPGSKVAILDTSVGSGRLLSHADPSCHRLAGADVDGACLRPLIEAARAAGFECDFVEAGFETLRPAGFGVCLINAPFGIHLDTPALQPLPCTTMGRYSAHSAAWTHEYAFDQALAAADIVAAIVPRAQGERIAAATSQRVRLVAHLPRGTFRAEGTDVETSIVVAGPSRRAAAPVVITLETLEDVLPLLDLRCANTFEATPRALNPLTETATAPATSLRVTGDGRVRVCHDGRRIVLRYSCALTWARVHNAVLRRPVEKPHEKHRYPASVRFAGQGLLDVEQHAAQPDPIKSLARLLRVIREADGTPVVHRGLLEHLRRRHREIAREREPYRHAALVDGAAGKDATALCTRTTLANPLRWGSPVFRRDARYPARREGDRVVVTHPTGETATFDERAFVSAFALEAAESHAEWTVVHQGREHAFPQLAHAIRAHLTRCGAADVVSWGYQLADVAEVLMAPRGCIGWSVGCGKARAAVALALAGGEANLICVESHLQAEMLAEIRALGLDPSLWQVIRRPEQCATLRRINIATYSRLKRPIVPGAGRRTFARLLRRRLSTVIADEAHLLRNPQSEQSRAVWMLSPKRRYAMTATPISNYTRDLMPLAWWAMGDATAAQPFGRYRPFFDEALLSSCDVARVGTEVYKEKFVVCEWITHEFVHSGLRTGAKREVPKPRNLDELRRWMAPIIKRRVAEEPDVAKHFAMPSYEVIRRVVPWDDAHLAYYLRVADEFKTWFESAKKDAGADGRAISLVSVLARVGAVTRACTYPQHATKHGRAYSGGLTSKQRALLDRLDELTAQGRRTICYVESPGMVNLFVRELGRRGIEGVPFHGDMPITARTRDLDRRFRFGSAPVLVATLGVTQTGLNLWQASNALFACGSWTPKTVRQAQGRLLRPQQTQHVVFEYFELEGSIDSYQAMGLDQKADTMDAALDLLTPSLADEPFLHLDAILDAFVANLGALRGVEGYAFREELKRAS